MSPPLESRCRLTPRGFLGGLLCDASFCSNWARGVSYENAGFYEIEVSANPTAADGLIGIGFGMVADLDSAPNGEWLLLDWSATGPMKLSLVNATDGSPSDNVTESDWYTHSGDLTEVESVAFTPGSPPYSVFVQVAGNDVFVWNEAGTLLIGSNVTEAVLDPATRAVGLYGLNAHGASVSLPAASFTWPENVALVSVEDVEDEPITYEFSPGSAPHSATVQWTAAGSVENTTVYAQTKVVIDSPHTFTTAGAHEVTVCVTDTQPSGSSPSSYTSCISHKVLVPVDNATLIEACDAATQCGPGGSCTPEGTCLCGSGRAGRYCDLVTTSSCNSGDVDAWSGGCLCADGNAGPDCSLFCGDAISCSGAGTCSSVATEVTCICDADFFGDDCGQSCTNDGRCNSNGLCELDEDGDVGCTCSDNYGGAFCNLFCDAEETCNGAGVCVFSALDATCECDDGAWGEFCSSPQSPVVSVGAPVSVIGVLVIMIVALAVNGSSLFRTKASIMNRSPPSTYLWMLIDHIQLTFGVVLLVAPALPYWYSEFALAFGWFAFMGRPSDGLISSLGLPSLADAGASFTATAGRSLSAFTTEIIGPGGLHPDTVAAVSVGTFAGLLLIVSVGFGLMRIVIWPLAARSNEGAKRTLDEGKIGKTYISVLIRTALVGYLPMTVLVTSQLSLGLNSEDGGLRLGAIMALAVLGLFFPVIWFTFYNAMVKDSRGMMSFFEEDFRFQYAPFVEGISQDKPNYAGIVLGYKTVNGVLLGLILGTPGSSLSVAALTAQAGALVLVRIAYLVFLSRSQSYVDSPPQDADRLLTISSILIFSVVLVFNALTLVGDVSDSILIIGSTVMAGLQGISLLALLILQLRAAYRASTRVDVARRGSADAAAKFATSNSASKLLNPMAVHGALAKARAVMPASVDEQKLSVARTPSGTVDMSALEAAGGLPGAQKKAEETPPSSPPAAKKRVATDLVKAQEEVLAPELTEAYQGTWSSTPINMMGDRNTMANGAPKKRTGKGVISLYAPFMGDTSGGGLSFGDDDLPDYLKPDDPEDIANDPWLQPLEEEDRTKSPARTRSRSRSTSKGRRKVGIAVDDDEAPPPPPLADVEDDEKPPGPPPVSESPAPAKKSASSGGGGADDAPPPPPPSQDDDDAPPPPPPSDSPATKPTPAPPASSPSSPDPSLKPASSSTPPPRKPTSSSAAAKVSVKKPTRSIPTRPGAPPPAPPAAGSSSGKSPARSETPSRMDDLELPAPPTPAIAKGDGVPPPPPGGDSDSDDEAPPPPPRPYSGFGW